MPSVPEPATKAPTNMFVQVSSLNIRISASALVGSLADSPCLPLIPRPYCTTRITTRSSSKHFDRRSYGRARSTYATMPPTKELVPEFQPVSRGVRFHRRLGPLNHSSDRTRDSWTSTGVCFRPIDHQLFFGFFDTIFCLARTTRPSPILAVISVKT